MNRDYPAAHSTDSTWFAIDARGAVAVFETGEVGQYPVSGTSSYGETGSQAVEYFRRLHPHLPRDGGIAVYAHDYGTYPQSPYERASQPITPLHVDQLPPELRDAFRRVRFESIRFAEAGFIQPFEFVECSLSDQGLVDAYLSADGMTVRPIPGREAHFADFVRHYREGYPESAAKLRFEGPTESDAAPAAE